MLSATIHKPSVFTGLPFSTWAFAARTFTAMMLALYAAFWLQLDGAASAMACVAILALPTRGGAFEKAIYRVLGTLIGVSVSIAIAVVYSRICRLAWTLYLRCEFPRWLPSICRRAFRIYGCDRSGDADRRAAGHIFGRRQSRRGNSGRYRLRGIHA